jgi:hypothetical protein
LPTFGHVRDGMKHGELMKMKILISIHPSIDVIFLLFQLSYTLFSDYFFYYFKLYAISNFSSHAIQIQSQSQYFICSKECHKTNLWGATAKRKLSSLKFISDFKNKLW